MASVSCFCEERRKSRQLSSCRHGTTKRVYRSMKGHEEGKLQKLSKNNWCCNLSFDNWGISHLQGEEQQKFRLVVTIERQCRTHRHWTIYPTSVLPVQLVLNKETKTPLTRNGWMVRVCLNSNNIVGANVQNVTGHYSAVNWYRCVSHCGAAKELLLCLFVYQLLSQQSRCVSRRNQILQPNLPRWQARKTRRGEKSTRSSKMVPRWCAGSETTKKKQIRTPSPNLPFWRKLCNRTWSLWTFADSERRTSRMRRISPPQSLARSETPPLRPLLVAELAWSHWDRGLRTANMTVTTRANPPSFKARFDSASFRAGGQTFVATSLHAEIDISARDNISACRDSYLCQR